MNDADVMARWLDELSTPNPNPTILASLEMTAENQGFHPRAVLDVLLGGPGFDADLHPRGRDGKFIEKLGMVELFDLPGAEPGQRGKVTGINADPKTPGRPNVQVELIGPDGKPGQSVTVKPNNIGAAPEKARLNAPGNYQTPGLIPLNPPNQGLEGPEDAGRGEFDNMSDEDLRWAARNATQERLLYIQDELDWRQKERAMQPTPDDVPVDEFEGMSDDDLRVMLDNAGPERKLYIQDELDWRQKEAEAGPAEMQPVPVSTNIPAQSTNVPPQSTNVPPAQITFGPNQSTIDPTQAKALADEAIAGRPITVADQVNIDDVIDNFADADAPVDLTLLDLFSAMRGNGVPRSQMPQIPPEQTDAFQDRLRAAGVDFGPDVVDPLDLKATQSELDGRSVGGIMRAARAGKLDLANNPMWISSDNHVLDGHHRWGAAAALSSNCGGNHCVEIPVVRIDMPMSELLAFANAFNDEIGQERLSFGDVTAPAGAPSTPGGSNFSAPAVAAAGSNTGVQPPQPDDNGNFTMATDAEDGVKDEDLANLSHGDGSAFGYTPKGAE